MVFLSVSDSSDIDDAEQCLLPAPTTLPTLVPTQPPRRVASPCPVDPASLSQFLRSEIASIGTPILSLLNEEEGVRLSVEVLAMMIASRLISQPPALEAAQDHFTAAFGSDERLPVGYAQRVFSRAKELVHCIPGFESGHFATLLQAAWLVAQRAWLPSSDGTITHLSKAQVPPRCVEIMSTLDDHELSSDLWMCDVAEPWFLAYWLSALAASSLVERLTIQSRSAEELCSCWVCLNNAMQTLYRDIAQCDGPSSDTVQSVSFSFIALIDHMGAAASALSVEQEVAADGYAGASNVPFLFRGTCHWTSSLCATTLGHLASFSVLPLVRVFPSLIPEPVLVPHVPSILQHVHEAAFPDDHVLFSLALVTVLLASGLDRLGLAPEYRCFVSHARTETRDRSQLVVNTEPTVSLPDNEPLSLLFTEASGILRHTKEATRPHQQVLAARMAETAITILESPLARIRASFQANPDALKPFIELYRLLAGHILCRLEPDQRELAFVQFSEARLVPFSSAAAQQLFDRNFDSYRQRAATAGNIEEVVECFTNFLTLLRKDMVLDVRSFITPIQQTLGLSSLYRVYAELICRRCSETVQGELHTWAEEAVTEYTAQMATSSQRARAEQGDTEGVSPPLALSRLFDLHQALERIFTLATAIGITVERLDIRIPLSPLIQAWLDVMAMRLCRMAREAGNRCGERISVPRPMAERAVLYSIEESEICSEGDNSSGASVFLVPSRKAMELVPYSESIQMAANLIPVLMLIGRLIELIQSRYSVFFTAANVSKLANLCTMVLAAFTETLQSSVEQAYSPDYVVLTPVIIEAGPVRRRVSQESALPGCHSVTPDTLKDSTHRPDPIEPIDDQAVACCLAPVASVLNTIRVARVELTRMREMLFSLADEVSVEDSAQLRRQITERMGPVSTNLMDMESTLSRLGAGGIISGPFSHIFRSLWAPSTCCEAALKGDNDTLSEHILNCLGGCLQEADLLLLQPLAQIFATALLTSVTSRIEAVLLDSGPRIRSFTQCNARTHFTPMLMELKDLFCAKDDDGVCRGLPEDVVNDATASLQETIRLHGLDSQCLIVPTLKETDIASMRLMKQWHPGSNITDTERQVRVINFRRYCDESVRQYMHNIRRLSLEEFSPRISHDSILKAHK